jgi:O-antigen/teichoic acid export membrane protein
MSGLGAGMALTPGIVLSTARTYASLLTTNAAGTVCGLAVQLLTIPVQLHFLGPEQFAISVLFNSFVMAGSLTDAGVGPTVLRFVARSQHRPSAVARVVVSAFTAVWGLSACIAIVAVLVGYAYARANGPDLIRGGITVWQFVVPTLVAVIASMFVGLGLNIVKGLKRYRLFAIIEASYRIALPSVAAVAAVTSRSAATVLAASAAWIVCYAIVSLLCAGRATGVRIGFTRHLRFFRHRMLQFSKWIWIQALFGYLGTQADRFVVVSLLSLSALAHYAVAMSACNAILAAGTAAGGFLLPEAASRVGNRRWLADAYARYTFVFSAGSAVAIVLFLTVSRRVLEAWLGGASVSVLPIMLPLLWSMSSAAASAPAGYLMNAMGCARFAAITAAVANTAVLLAMIVGGSMYGLPGLIAGKLLSVPCGFALRAIVAKQIFQIDRPVRAALKMVWPTLLGALVVLPISLRFLGN